MSRAIPPALAARAAAPDADRVDDTVRRCWADGNSIQETRLIVLRCCGVELDFHRIQRAFAGQADRAVRAMEAARG